MAFAEHPPESVFNARIAGART